MLFNLPAMLIALDVVRNHAILKLEKIMMLNFFLSTIGAFKVFPRLMGLQLFELTDVYGGGGTQALSYFMAFAVISGLSWIGDDVYRLSRNIRIFIIFASALMFLVGILAGGRGAFLVILGFVFVFFRRIFKASVLGWFYVGLLALLCYFLFFNMFHLDRFGHSFARIFSYIGNNGIDFSQGSNRDVFYERAIDLINQRPIFGYGIFRFMDFAGGTFYSHNIFLDVLLQGGFILGLISIVLVIKILLRFSYIRYKLKGVILLKYPIYAFTMLLFTNIYLNEPLFWFSIVVLFQYSFKGTTMVNWIANEN